MSKYGHRTINWLESIVNKLGGEEAGDAFLRGELAVQAIRRLLAISRAGNSVYTGTGLVTWLGRKNGDGFSGEPQRDPRSLAFTEIDIEKIQFKSYLDVEEGETVITGENRWKALRWLYDNRKVAWMEFPEVLRFSYGFRCFLYLCRNVGGSWSWFYGLLDSVRYASRPAAVLEGK